MEWFFYSLLCAFFLATSDTFSKRALQDINEYLVAWGRLLAAIPVLISILIIFQPSLHIDKTFLFIVASIIPLEISALVLYMKAIKISPLSLTVPFLALTPVFLIGTSYIMLKELPDFSGAIGILFVAIGAYTLNIDNLKEEQELSGILERKFSYTLHGNTVYVLTINGTDCVVYTERFDFELVSQIDQLQVGETVSVLVNEKMEFLGFPEQPPS